MTVKLPRRLPDREPVRSDPPSEREWLQRAIRHIEHWGPVEAWVETIEGDTAAGASVLASRRREAGEALPLDATRDDFAGWLRLDLRRIPIDELRTRLDALDTQQDNP